MSSHNHDYDHPFALTGDIHSNGWEISVRLQTSNPTTQHRKGQLFVENQRLTNGLPFNQNIALMLRRLASSVENQWDNIKQPKL